MAKETYTYKNILLGLRPEFLEAKEKLEELKAYSMANPRFVKDYNFYLSKYLSVKLPELMVKAEINHSDFIRIIYELRKRITGFIDEEESIMVKNNNGIYYPLSHERIKVGVKPKYSELFYEIAEELLNSDFAQYINFDAITTLNGCNIVDIYTKFYNLYLRVSALDKPSVMTYEGRNDKLQFQGIHNTLLTQDYLQYLLSLEFPTKYFSDYHQEIINSHLDDEVEILLPDSYIPCSNAKFEIEDNFDELILRRVPPKK